MNISVNKLAELLAKTRAAKIAALEKLEPSPSPSSSTPNEIIIDNLDSLPDLTQGVGRTGEIIQYNTKQQEFISLATSTKSGVILIGAAGTGKTTCMRGVIESLTISGKAGVLSGVHKYLPSERTPGIVAVSFTRRAVNNLRLAMPAGMDNNCITIHKLLEYEPVYYDVMDPITHELKKTMRFEPTRHQFNKLSSSIKYLIIDESSMVSVDLFKELIAALPEDIIVIFLGDIQQLPPVFGPAILGYKMLELPTVELTEVYRQALESPIIRLAHRILSGVPISLSEYPSWCYRDELTLRPWKKKISSDNALMMTNILFCGSIGNKNVPVEKQTVGMIDEGIYDPEADMILMPFNKAYGTIELNKYIAQHLAKKRGSPVYEVIAGYNKVYYSVGDKVLYDREDAIILSIVPNAVFSGKSPQPHSLTLDYWGHEHGKVKTNVEAATDDEMDDYLNKMSVSGSDEDRVRAASHVIVVQMMDSGVEVSLDSAAAINSLLMSYALTVHKSQGSEWRKVFLLFHQSHATMMQRELLYTAVTRAKKELVVICEDNTFTNGIKSQRIKGNTLAEKAEFFKGKKEDNGGTY